MKNFKKVSYFVFYWYPQSAACLLFVISDLF